MIEQLATELLALDGAGGAAPYATLSQWEARQEERASSPEVESRPKEQPPKPRLASKPRLTWNEQRELEGMEGQILAAEAELESLRHAMSDPSTIANHEKMRDVCTRADAAERRVSGLYSRWQELEAKRK